MFSFVAEFTHPYQTKIERILPQNVLDQLRATECANIVIEYMEAMAKQTYHQFIENTNAMRKYINYESFWKKFTVSQRMDQIMSKYRQKFLLEKINKYMEYINDSMPRCITDILQVLLKKKLLNDVTFTQLIEQKFVKKHNGLMKKLEKNEKCGIKNAIDCMRQHTTQRQYKFWRKKVYIKIKIYIICVHSSIKIFDLTIFLIVYNTFEYIFLLHCTVV